MRAAVNAFALLCAAVVLTAALPGYAEEGPAGSGQSGGDRWVPSAAIITGVLVQDWEADVSSELARTRTVDPPFGRTTVSALRPPDDGTDQEVMPIVGGNLELMTPELPVFLRPRFFVGGEIAAGFGFERRIAREGQPGTIASPAPEAAVASTPFDGSTALGQGSLTVAQTGDAVYGAHAGIAFPFELGGRQLRIKPSFAWTRFDIEVKGSVVSAECHVIDPGVTGTNGCTTLASNPGKPGFLRETRFAADETETFDGIGPGLDLEMDTGRFGPLGTSLFLGARLYKILGDRDIALSVPALSVNDALIPAGDPLGVDTSSAKFNFEVDEWIYRLGIGIRFQWLGSAD